MHCLNKDFPYNFLQTVTPHCLSIWKEQVQYLKSLNLFDGTLLDVWKAQWALYWFLKNLGQVSYLCEKALFSYPTYILCLSKVWKCQFVSEYHDDAGLERDCWKDVCTTYFNGVTVDCGLLVSCYIHGKVQFTSKHKYFDENEVIFLSEWLLYICIYIMGESLKAE